MNIKRDSADRIVVEASAEEVRILKDCLLNLDNLCDEGEFHTYVGATKVEVRRLTEKFLSVLRQSPDEK